MYFITRVLDDREIDSLEPLTAVSENDLACWREVPSVRTYVRQAMAPTGCMLNGDKEALNALKSAHYQRVHVEQAEQRRLELTQL